MKTYYNGPRQGMMYGGGANMRKPMMDGGTVKKMQMGGLAEQNRNSAASQSAIPNPMGTMTEKKRYDMGMMYGGQAKLDKNKDGKISGKDFKMMKKK
jgi:hypothetical protein